MNQMKQLTKLKNETQFCTNYLEKCLLEIIYKKKLIKKDKYKVQNLFWQKRILKHHDNKGVPNQEQQIYVADYPKEQIQGKMKEQMNSMLI
ncbi:unnamed protein product [Paramecium sonneborni]|uniref:Uncharacterized protein n=1 Tax=Paramecium sonneborni TaxID=65129 RepID=A0A8S1RSJ0_9CILI|nr:unnamed protein product [Paramecium sonneborni]